MSQHLKNVCLLPPKVNGQSPMYSVWRRHRMRSIHLQQVATELNRAAATVRIFMSTRKLVQITPLLKSLHRLPVSQRIYFKKFRSGLQSTECSWNPRIKAKNSDAAFGSYAHLWNKPSVFFKSVLQIVYCSFLLDAYIFVSFGCPFSLLFNPDLKCDFSVLNI